MSSQPQPTVPTGHSNPPLRFPFLDLKAEYAALVGCPCSSGCASGSDALLLALMAVGVDSGDEIITAPFTFVATAGSIARLKAKPVFVDIDPETFNLDEKRLESAFTD